MLFLMIRQATEDDIPAILIMCSNFWKHTAYEEAFDSDEAEDMVYLAMDHGLLAVVDDVGEHGLVGFVAGIKGPLMAAKNVLTGTELAWWIEPGHRKGRKGIELMLYIEKLAKMQGIKYWNMISMESSAPETANRIYERLGYTKTETSYTKVI